METVDFKKVYRDYYSPKPGRPEIITTPKMRFVMVDGRGDPNDSIGFQHAIETLYGIAYGLKFGRKKAGLQPDFSIGPLEGLWWNESGKEFEMGKKEDWLWTLMLWLPDFITAEEVKGRLQELKAKKPNPALEGVRLEWFDEGMVVQIMHIGPYDAEGPDIGLMQAYAREQGYTQSRKHHEIYLGDPRRAAPEKLRTILRQPIRRITK